MLIFCLMVFLLSLMYLWLTINVVRQRREARLAYGSSDDLNMTRAIRAHANFIEYTPFAMIVLLSLVIQQVNVFVLVMLSVSLLLGRFLHSIGLLKQEANNVYRGRRIGMMLTLFCILVGSGYSLVLAVIHTL